MSLIGPYTLLGWTRNYVFWCYTSTVDRIKSDHDATIAFFPIPYDLQAIYKREVWLYKHGNYDGLNSEIDQFDWNSHLSLLNDIDDMSSKFSNKYIELAKKLIPVKTNYQA